ncbi:MAG: hypothetical protein WBC95_02160 [Albidovulum sp.]
MWSRTLHCFLMGNDTHGVGLWLLSEKPQAREFEESVLSRCDRVKLCAWNGLAVWRAGAVEELRRRWPISRLKVIFERRPAARSLGQQVNLVSRVIRTAGNELHVIRGFKQESERGDLRKTAVFEKASKHIFQKECDPTWFGFGFVGKAKKTHAAARHAILSSHPHDSRGRETFRKIIGVTHSDCGSKKESGV